MNKQTINTFIKGMNKDIDKSVISKDSFLDGRNFRIVTSEGSSSGAFENIKGNKLIGENHLTSTGPIVNGNKYLVVKASVTYDGTAYALGTTFTGAVGVGTFVGDGKVLDLSNTDMLPEGQLICGGGRLRDYIILFTTSNTGVPVHGVGRSMIFKLALDKTNEEVTSLTKLYDDNLNAGLGTDTLDFSTLYKIKLVTRYETPNIQKGYWTDSYNNIRYADFAKNLTITGSAYTGNDYMETTMFEFLPAFTPSRPTLVDMISGNLYSGVVQYSYQLYRLNGAETAFSPVGDIIHLTTSNDFKTSTLTYYGDSTNVPTGKGCKIRIVNSNSGYERLRLIRIYYPTLGSVPTISIAKEIEISTSPSTVDITDIGDIVSSLTIDEFNISSTELFKCEDLTIKDNRLFVGNIDKSEFTVDFDVRAVRFKRVAGVPYDVNYAGVDFSDQGDFATYASWVDDATIRFTITNFTSLLVIDSGLPVSSTITAVNSITFNVLASNPVVQGTYTDTVPTPGIPFVISDPDYSITMAGGVLGYNVGTDTLTFEIASTTGNIFTNFLSFDSAYLAQAIGDSIIFNIDYTETITPYINTSVLVDAIEGDVTINEPAGDTPAQWDAANWNLYIENHDGINEYNNPDNDGTASKEYIYQSDGSTLGAEGPYVKIDFESEEFILDSSNNDTTFYSVPPSSVTDLSYTNYASPWKGGKLSWQRDEVYRLFAVWGNDRGQTTNPDWIIDLRIPSLHESNFTNSSSNTVYPSVLANEEGDGSITSNILYPRIYFKSFPANATWVQIYRVKRERDDRFVVTQCYAISSYLDSDLYRPEQANVALLNSEEIVKLVSPEININRNISYRANDYLEYVTRFADTTGFTTTEEAAGTPGYGNIHKMKTNTRFGSTANNKTNIESAIVVSPLSAVTDDAITINGIRYCNFNEKAIPTAAKGCTGLLVAYTNGSWSAEGVKGVIVNYKSNVYGSQYGGHTYEDRGLNTSIACSDIIKTSGVWHDVSYGDTYINYFDCSTLLHDLSATTINSYSETLYVPLESSINCDLRHDIEARHNMPYPYSPSLLRQEYQGDHINASGLEFVQTKDLYLYNTVYSQQTSIKYGLSTMLDLSTELVFDCLVKSSDVKVNGELSDSWTKFKVNEEIEVDSNHGELRALSVFNDKLLFWQEDAFGVLSVNTRSLIQDSSNTQLALGTGGILDRYDYISTNIGILNKFSIVNSNTGVYWFYDKDFSIYKFSNILSNVTKEKGMWSWFKTTYSSSYNLHGVYDRINNEVLYTLYNPSTGTGHTLPFNEQVDAYGPFCDFVPYMYVDYTDGYLSTKPFVTNTYSLIFIHNSNINPRCRFYSLLNYSDTDTVNTFASTIKLLFNDDYPITKVFDSIFYISNSFDETTDVEQYNITFDKFRCYNDYQNSDWVTLTYPTNIMRRDRGWAINALRNLLEVDYTSSPNIFTPINIDSDGTKLWHERIRDKYMVLDLSFNNLNKHRFVVPFIGIQYRVSYR